MLKLVNRKSRDNDPYFKKLNKLIDEADGAVLVVQKNQTLQVKYFGLKEEELIHALEWAKVKILLEDE